MHHKTLHRADIFPTYLASVGKYIGLSALCLCLAGCATGFHQRGLTGGYEDKQLGPETFQVGFFGNAKVTLDQAHDFACLRAAQVTLDHGFDSFSVLHQRWDNWESIATVKPYCVLAIHCFKGIGSTTNDFEAVSLQTALKSKYGLQ